VEFSFLNQEAYFLHSKSQTLRVVNRQGKRLPNDIEGSGSSSGDRGNAA